MNNTNCRRSPSDEQRDIESARCMNQKSSMIKIKSHDRNTKDATGSRKFRYIPTVGSYRRKSSDPTSDTFLSDSFTKDSDNFRQDPSGSFRIPVGSHRISQDTPSDPARSASRIHRPGHFMRQPPDSVLIFLLRSSNDEDRITSHATC